MNTFLDYFGNSGTPFSIPASDSQKPAKVEGTLLIFFSAFWFEHCEFNE